MFVQCLNIFKNLVRDDFFMESGWETQKLDKASLKITKTFNISAFKIIVLEIN